MRAAVLAVIDKEIRLRAVWCSILARIGVRSPLRHSQLFSFLGSNYESEMQDGGHENGTRNLLNSTRYIVFYILYD